jgi:hypothetical protein
MPTACSTGSYNISDSNDVAYNNVNISMYSPCTVSVSNSTSMSGQLLGGTLLVNNQLTMNFVPVLVPGVGNIDGFNEDIAYIREVRAT